MRQEDIPWWLRADLEILGFEDEDDDDEEDESEEDEDESEEDEDDSEEDEDEEDEEDEDEKPKKKSKAKGPDIDGLKSALRKERMARKRLERDLKKLKPKEEPKKAAKEEDKDKGPTAEDLAAERQRAEREERLAVKLRDNAIDTLILQFAGDFTNPREAVALVNRREIEVDQDDDDPSEIEVDEESVQDAVRALAKKSPHLLKPKGERRSKSGSKFGGKKKGNREPSDEALREKYAALRH